MVKIIAYYLPQYHPIEENDTWWGKGFTEWTNVTKAQPLFKGHYQPRFPSDLGYYDLRIPEVRNYQAQLAKENGIDGFCYYHYWFGNNKTLLERPLQEILKFKEPDFPFCICWANETWKGIWFGKDDKSTLIEQQYPGKQDYINHFYYLLPAFKDNRYIKIEGKCVFNVYMPAEIPDLELFVSTFKELAIKEGLGELYFLATRAPENWIPGRYGFDGVIGSEFTTLRYVTIPALKNNGIFSKLFRRIYKKIFNRDFVNLNFEEREKPLVVEYKDAIENLLPKRPYNFDYFPCAIQDWDNTARAGKKSVILNNSTPQLWKKHLTDACDYVTKNSPERPYVFIKSWNEWAEGNYLEPDLKWGSQYLNVVKEVKEEFNLDEKEI